MKRPNIKKLTDNVKSAPKSQQYMIGGLGVLCLMMLSLVMFIDKDNQESVADNFSNLPPMNFFPESNDEPVQVVDTKPDYGVDDVFQDIILVPDVDAIRQKKAQEEFDRNRAKVSSIQRISYEYEDADNEPDYSITNITAYQNMDLDYSKQGEPKTVTSYPVDLSRVLPITETVQVILLDEIKSELSGEVVRAKISQNVYGYHNRKILIPAGSTAIGRYEPLKKIGDTRLDIEFYRILTPEGVNIQLVGFAADSEGSQGLTGEIDNKNWEKFGVAGIAATIQAGTQLSVDVDDNNQEAVADSIAEPVGEVITQVLAESINIAPTVRIQKGTTFLIKFQTDIFFPPARDRQVLTKPVNDRAFTSNTRS